MSHRRCCTSACIASNGYVPRYLLLMFDGVAANGGFCDPGADLNCDNFDAFDFILTYMDPCPGEYAGDCCWGLTVDGVCNVGDIVVISLKKVDASTYRMTLVFWLTGEWSFDQDHPFDLTELFTLVNDLVHNTYCLFDTATVTVTEYTPP